MPVSYDSAASGLTEMDVTQIVAILGEDCLAD